jgi:hypothetical protein
MAKLIGHYFCSGTYGTFAVNELKETPKQYAKTKDTLDNTPKYVYEYWSIMPKTELGKLRRQCSHGFTMYGLHDDMPRFKEVVIAELEKRTANAKGRYNAAVELLEKAKGEKAHEN